MIDQLLKEPKGWSKKKIKQLCNLGRGRVISEEEIKAHTGIYPVYSSQTVNKGKMGEIDKYDFEGEYVTWTTDGAYAGTVFYRSGRFNCTNVCGTLKSKDEHLSMKYLSYALSTKAQKHVSYVGNPKLMNNIMAEIELILPDNEKEQSQIAVILSTVDEAIDKAEALIQKYQRIKQGVMQDLLTKGIDENGNIRSEKTHKFEDSPLGRIPEEWEVNPIGKECKQSGGSIQTGPFGSQLHAKDYKENGIPIITVEHLAEGKILHQNLPLVGEADYRRLRKYVLKYGDLVFSRVGAIDRCSFTSYKEEGWLFSGRCLRVRGGSRFDAKFLSYLLNYDTCKQWILNNAVGSTMKCLNTTILSNLPIKMPTLPEQSRIASILSQADETIQKEETYKQKLLSLKRGLMEDLLTGKVRVNHLLN